MAEVADSTIIPHIFGTIAIISMFFVVGTYYEGFYKDLKNEAYRAQLGQVADYVASNLIDLITLCQLTEENQFLIKDVEFPTFIGEKLYNLSIVTMVPSYGDPEVFRVITRIDSLNIYSVSDLPWSINANIQIYTNQTVDPYEGVLNPSSHLPSNAAIVKAIQDGASSMVVWCSKSDGVITIGLGVMDRSSEV